MQNLGEYTRACLSLRSSGILTHYIFKGYQVLRQIGSIYLILGTCIAAGMLGLPVVTADNTYWLTTINIISAWILMTAGAWTLLQVNLWLKPGTNLISMAEATLGPVIKAITWVVYLLLLYSLICAYLAAGGDVLQSLLHNIHIQIPRTAATILATLMLAVIVYRGIYCVDIVNRVLMSAKIVICFLLIALITPHVYLPRLSLGSWHWHASSWLVMICSFGYAIILPSIREYLHSNRRQLTQVVFIGSIIPMLLYLVWIAVIQGTLHRHGPNSLIAMNHSSNTVSILMMQLSALTHHPIVETISILFISLCSVTGLLGVSLSLMDFLADGLHRKKQGLNKLLLTLLTFTPPMLVVIVKPAVFTYALTYAGLFCLYVLVALPISMYIIGKRKGMHLDSSVS